MAAAKQSARKLSTVEARAIERDFTTDGVSCQPIFIVNLAHALYIARELFSPWEQPVDGRADVYSLSRIVYYYSAFGKNF